MIAPLAHIAAMAPYALASLSAPKGKPLISLSQNESLRPPSPLALQAASRAMASANRYPDPDWADLRRALSDLHNVPAGQILCGNGSLDLIACLTRSFCDGQNAVLAPAHAYPFFRSAAAMVGARFDTAEEAKTTVSVDTLLSAIRPDTRIVFLANPGNPTSTRIPKSELLGLRDAMPDAILLVIDEAYGEFADHLHEPSFDMVQRGNTVVLRTLSKAYGLAGMRVGWGLFPPDITAQLRKVMNPNNISLAAQAAASAAVADQPYMRETCQITATLRDSFITRLRAAGFDIPDSHTNFALIRLASAAQAQSADKALQAEGILLRPQSGAGLPHCLRATVGSQAELNKTAQILEHWQQGVPK